MIFKAGSNAYSLLHEHKSGWNPEMFRERYSEVLERFDYIVGDWGYNQLRLRGFYREGNPRATKESTISSLVDYINEYCNFGCAYFVLNKVDSQDLPADEGADVESLDALAAALLTETSEQAAETAAASGGPLMRWPLKERVGGPVRAPNVTLSAVARAAADAERRNASANASVANPAASVSSIPAGRGSHPRQGHEGGGASGRQGRSFSGPPGAERRQQQGQGNGGGYQGSNYQGNKQSAPPRSPRIAVEPKGSGQQEETRNPETVSNRNEIPRNGNSWPGKNRRRKSFGGGGKPGHRQDDSPRSED